MKTIRKIWETIVPFLFVAWQALKDGALWASVFYASGAILGYLGLLNGIAFGVTAHAALFLSACHRTMVDLDDAGMMLDDLYNRQQGGTPPQHDMAGLHGGE